MTHSVFIRSGCPLLPGYYRSYQLLEPHQTVTARHFLEWAPGAWTPLDPVSIYVGLTAGDLTGRVAILLPLR